jgi:hypothetical protein
VLRRLKIGYQDVSPERPRLILRFTAYGETGSSHAGLRRHQTSQWLRRRARVSRHTTTALPNAPLDQECLHDPRQFRPS